MSCAQKWKDRAISTRFLPTLFLAQKELKQMALSLAQYSFNFNKVPSIKKVGLIRSGKNLNLMPNNEIFCCSLKIR